VIGISRAYNSSSTYKWYWTTDFGGFVDQTVGGGGADTQSPSAPTASASAVSATQVNVSWTASTDNVGVNGYQILGNGSVMTQVGGSMSSYSDNTVTANAAYSYVVKAFDAAGNYSNSSNAAQVTTPGNTSTSQCPAPSSNAFTGCYYNNINLSGNPVLVRND